MTGSFRLLTAVTFTVRCYGCLRKIPFVFVAPFRREAEASYTNLKIKRNPLYVKRFEALSIHLFLFVFGRVFLELYYFRQYLKPAAANAALCVVRRRTKKKEKRKRAFLLRNLNAARNNPRMAHVPPPCSSARRGTELIPCRVVLRRRAVSKN